MTPAAALRSRLAPATAYAHALTAARDLQVAIDAEDVPGALHAVAVWSSWILTSRKDAPQ